MILCRDIYVKFVRPVAIEKALAVSEPYYLFPSRLNNTVVSQLCIPDTNL